jgi:hypothetical protein
LVAMKFLVAAFPGTPFSFHSNATNQPMFIDQSLNKRTVGIDVGSYLDTATLGTDIDIHASLFVATVEGNTTYNSALQSWQVLLSGDCRIFVLHCVSIYTPMALTAARVLGILDNPKVLHCIHLSVVAFRNITDSLLAM